MLVDSGEAGLDGTHGETSEEIGNQQNARSSPTMLCCLCLARVVRGCHRQAIVWVIWGREVYCLAGEGL